MNNNQIEFSYYWDTVANAVFYKVVKITESPSFADKILDNQRNKLSMCIKEEINRIFFNTKMRPKATVWLEKLKKAYPNEADKLENFLQNCEITSKGYENILTIAAGGTASIVGAAIAKKNIFASTFLILGGAAAAGYKVASGLSVDTATLQKEVKKQCEAWRTSMLNILAACDDVDSAENNDEQ